MSVVTRSMQAVAAITLVLALVAGCATSVEKGPDPADSSQLVEDDFLEVTDCRELEQLAAAEVDRITAAEDQVIVDEATARFNRIVAHRDTVC